MQRARFFGWQWDGAVEGGREIGEEGRGKATRGGIRGVVGEQSWGAGSSAGKRYVSFFSLDRRARSEKGGEGRGQQEGGGGQVRRKEVRERRLRERGRGELQLCCADLGWLGWFAQGTSLGEVGCAPEAAIRHCA